MKVAFRRVMLKIALVEEKDADGSSELKRSQIGGDKENLAHHGKR